MSTSQTQPRKARSLLGTQGLSESELRSYIERAKAFKKSQQKTLENKTVILLFFEPSTRTRSSFELATKRLGGNTLILTKDGTSTEKGETLADTARTIQAMEPSAIVLRHPSAGSPHHLSRILNLPIINAGDGFHEHPTQALLDCMTIEEFKGNLQGKKILIVGDIAHSRVARSDIYAFKTLGADVSVCGPPTLLPPKIESFGVKVFTDIESAVKGQDVVMLLRLQLERLNQGQLPSRGEYSRFYGMTSRVLDLCRPDVLIMHPGPINRGVELAPEVADGSRSVILNQVANGVLIRMAVLDLLTGAHHAE